MTELTRTLAYKVQKKFIASLNNLTLCITHLLPCRLNPHLPPNTINQNKSRMPNVANSVGALVICALNHQCFYCSFDTKTWTANDWNRDINIILNLRH